MKYRGLICLLVLLAAALASAPAWAQTVKVTPLGAVAGQFCAADRALLFEDPTGVRVLIAPGRTVGTTANPSVGSADPRLGSTGSVHVVLIDHPHVDHIGDRRHLNCDSTSTVPFAAPGSTEGNASEIAAVHKSAVLVGGELPDFFTQKLNNSSASFNALTAAQKNCPAAGLNNVVKVPFTDRAVNDACVGVIRGGTRTAVFTGQTTGVKITTIPAFHAAGAARIHVDELIDPDGTNPDPGVPLGLTGYAGHETGYILRFTNGLSVLWTGDSGLIGDWATQAKFYGVNLAVVHGGDVFTMGPDEAAFAVKELIKPRSVIPEHFNQPSATTDGSGNPVVTPGTRLERFISQLKGQTKGKGGARVVVPLSDATFEFDGDGDCVAGPGC